MPESQSEWFERETLERALAGDHEAGTEALKQCITGLYSGKMSERLRFYLAKCLIDLVDGVKAERALNIEIERGPGRPRDPFPDWETPLAAFAELLRRRGYRPGQIADAMDVTRQAVEERALDPKEARRILKTYQPMQQLEDSDLEHLCIEGGYGGEIGKYFPLL